MGQYHFPVNLDKKEYILSHKIGLGLKMAEQIGAWDATMGDIIYLLVASSHSRGGGDVPSEGLEAILGRWAGDHIAVIGDYSEATDVESFNAEEVFSELENPEKGWTEISNLVIPMIQKLWGMDISGDGWRNRERAAYYPDAYLGENPPEGWKV